jgi:Asp/Glu/hydantoin racemase
MPKSLALIHTSFVFINVETMMRDLFAEIMPDVRLINIVDDSLLADVMRVGEIRPEVQQRMNHYVEAAARTGADAVLSLCSSLGPTIDEARTLVSIPVIKIDDAMTAKAAAEADRLGVMATVKTTLAPTVSLIRSKATAMSRQVEIHPCLVAGAFEILMSGQREHHDELVVAAARELASRVDLIVLAQASMTRLAPRLQTETGLTVLSSPRLAIEYTKSVLDGLGRNSDAPTEQTRQNTPAVC